MLSIHPLTIGMMEYYLNLDAEDYYLNGGPGRWWGLGSAAKGLEGTVQREQFHSLFLGYLPDSNEALVQNAGVSDRHVGDDLVFSMPKSAAICLVQSDGPKRKDLLQDHGSSVEAALRFAEKHFAVSRIGKGGRKHIPVQLIVSIFDHITNRNMDLNPHSHALVFNTGVSIDGHRKTRALDNRFLYSKIKKVIGAYYRANYAYLLTEKHGFSCKRKGESYEVRGVPAELIEAHSTRRHQILAYIKKHKLDKHSAKDAAKAAVATRRTKQKVPPREEFYEMCREVNRKHGFTDKSLRRLVRRVKRNLQRDIEAALAVALKNLTKTHTHFDGHDLLYEMLLEAPERGLPPDAVLSMVAGCIDVGINIIELQHPDGKDRYTTIEMLKNEKRLLDSMKRLQQTPGVRINDRILNKALAKWPTTRPDQVEAVRHLAQGTGSIRILCGLAGSGKTHMLKILHEACKEEGINLIGTAETGKAARVLEDSTGIPSQTLHRRLGDYKTSFWYKVKHHARQFGRAARKKSTHKLKNPRPVHVDNRTILVVDESGMMNLRHFQMCFDLVQRGGGTLLLVGDPAQLPPVDGTAPFQSICERVGCAELTEVQRQKDEWARLATRLFADGHAGDALDLYAKHGLVTVHDSLDEALEALLLDWVNPGLTHPQDAVILADTNRRSEMANRLCQQKRIDAQCLDTSASLEIIDDDPSRGVTYTNRVYRGDRVMFTRNNRKYSVENGTLGTVIGLSKLRNAISVKLNDGRRTIIPVAKFPHIRLGYAGTVYKAQGSTLPSVLVLANGYSENLPLSYVEATRGVLVTRFYTEKAFLDESLEQVHNSRLAKQMSRKPDLRLATELLRDAPLDRQLNQADIPPTSVGLDSACNLDQPESGTAATLREPGKMLPDESPLNQGLGHKHWTRRFYYSHDPNAQFPLGHRKPITKILPVHQQPTVANSPPAKTLSGSKPLLHSGQTANNQAGKSKVTPIPLDANPESSGKKKSLPTNVVLNAEPLNISEPFIFVANDLTVTAQSFYYSALEPLPGTAAHDDLMETFLDNPCGSDMPPVSLDDLTQQMAAERLQKEDERKRLEKERQEKEAIRLLEEIERKKKNAEEMAMEKQRLIAAAEKKKVERRKEKERKRKEAEEKKKAAKLEKQAAKQRKLEAKRKYRQANPGWRERRCRLREEEQKREEERLQKAIKEQQELERQQKIAHQEYLEWLELEQKEEERKLKELEEQMGPVAFKKMLEDQARLKAEHEAKVIEMYEEYLQSQRKIRLAQQAHKKSAAASSNSSMSSCSSSGYNYVPLSSPPTSYQYSGHSGTSSPAALSSTSPQSTTSDLSYGAAQTQRTQQDNNAIRKT